jgi:hypothetical protein
LRKPYLLYTVSNPENRSGYSLVDHYGDGKGLSGLKKDEKSELCHITVILLLPIRGK